jgi:hypothetical protein
VLGGADSGDTFLGEETIIFTGLLNDESLTMDLDSLRVTFQVLGRESLMDRISVPFSDVANGDNLSDIILACLDQAPLNELLTVDVANINLGLDPTVDDVSEMENATVREVLRDLLLIANSVIYVDGDSIVVAPRDASASVEFSFYGQSSAEGIENIQTIKSIKNGLSRTFNFLTWKDTAVFSADADSIIKYGVRKKEFSVPYMTDSVKQEDIMEAVVTEFAFPKMEFDLYTTLSYETFALNLLDRIDIDYPVQYIESEDEFPICGVAICGQAILPKGIWAFSLNQLKNFKLVGRTVDIKAGTIKFRMREI